MNRLNKTESALFLYCRFPLFLKDPFFSDYFDCWISFTPVFSCTIGDSPVLKHFYCIYIFHIIKLSLQNVFNL